MSRQWKLQADQRSLCDLPPEKLQQHDEPQPRSFWLSDNMRCVSQHNSVDSVVFQSQQHTVPTNWSSYDASLLQLSREQQLYDSAHKLLRLSPDGLSEHDQS